MGYMFNKQLRGYNTEEVDDTIETLEKKIQETTLQIRRLEKELDKVKKENISMANRQSVERKTNEEIFSFLTLDRKSTRLNSSHVRTSRMPSSA